MITREDFSSLDIFNGFNDDELSRVLRCAQELEFKSKEIIIEESSISYDLYLICKGRVSIELDVMLPQGVQREQMVILRAGDIFGEIGFLEKKRRSAYVIAIDDIRALKLDEKQLKDLFGKQYDIGYLFMRNLAVISAQRLIKTNFRWRNDIRMIHPCQKC